MKEFVFPNHELHKIYRTLTSTCSLMLKHGLSPAYNFSELDAGSQFFLTQRSMFSVKDGGFGNYCNMSGGINLTNRSVEQRTYLPVRQVGYRMPAGYLDHDQPVAFEILSYGVGVMRSLNPPITTFRKIIGGD